MKTYGMKKCVGLAAVFILIMAGCLNMKVLARDAENSVVHKGNQIIQAEEYDVSELGADVLLNDFAADENSLGGTFIGGNYLHYSNIDFEEGSYNTLLLLISAQNSESGKKVELRIDEKDGAKIGEIIIDASNETAVFKDHYVPINSISGIHDLYLVFQQNTTINIDWLTLSAYDGTETEMQKRERMQWWRDAHYGQFIHWGAYAQLGGVYNGSSTDYAEWGMCNLGISREDYERDAAALFNPTKFNAKEIVSLAKESGQKYMIFTSRHHEGFSMFDTQIRGFKDYGLLSYGTYKGVDPVMELSRECEKEDIKFGVYYTIMEWHDSSQEGVSRNTTMLPGRKEEYKTRLKGQLCELVKKYHVKVLWFDGEWVSWWTKEDGQELYRFLRTLDPSIIVNNRVGKRHADDGDFGTPEQEVPSAGLDYDWESCMTLNESWGYHKLDKNWKSAGTVISNLVDVTSKGGNYLLNIGPDELGNIPDESAAILTEAGKWLETYGDSIYGTQRTCFEELPSGIKVTTAMGKVYIHLLSFPKDKKVTIPKLNNEILDVNFMGTGQETSYTITKTGYTIDLDGITADQYDTVIEIDVDGIPEAAPQEPAVNIALQANEVIASDVYDNNQNYNGKKAVDGDTSTRWATNDGVKNGTLELRFDQPVTVNQARFLQFNSTATNYTNAFKIEYWENGRWVTAYTGGKIEAEQTVYFDQITADRIRLNLIEASNPSYYEFQLFHEDRCQIEMGGLDGQQIIIDELPFGVKGTAMGGTHVEITLSGADFAPVKYTTPVQENGTWELELDKMNSGINKIKAALLTEEGEIVAVAQSSVTVRESKNLAKGMKVSASSEYTELPGYEASMAVDGNLSTRWSPDNGDNASEIMIDFKKMTTFNKIIINEMLDTWVIPNTYRCQKFQISAYNGKSWSTIYEGNGIGEELSLELPEVNAEKLKLSILEVKENAAGAVNIQEIEVYNKKKAADKTKLQDAIAKAEARLKDGKTYTPESLKELKDILEKAKKIAEKESAEQEEVDAQVVSIQNAVNKLKENPKNDISDKPKDDPKPEQKKVQLSAPVITKITSSVQYITVKFNAVKGAKNYKIYRKVGNKKTVELKSVMGTSFRDSRFEGGKTISYYIKAVARDSEKNTDSLLGKGKSIKLPGSTKITKVKKVKRNSNVITWKRVKGATGYVVLRSTKKNGKYSKIATIKKNKTVTYCDTKKLKSKKTYYYKIVTQKRKNYGPASKAVS